jgi:hypothetical protein
MEYRTDSLRGTLRCHPGESAPHGRRRMPVVPAAALALVFALFTAYASRGPAEAPPSRPIIQTSSSALALYTPEPVKKRSYSRPPDSSEPASLPSQPAATHQSHRNGPMGTDVPDPLSTGSITPAVSPAVSPDYAKERTQREAIPKRETARRTGVASERGLSRKPPSDARKAETVSRVVQRPRPVLKVRTADRQRVRMVAVSRERYRTPPVTAEPLPAQPSAPCFLFCF